MFCPTVRWKGQLWLALLLAVPALLAGSEDPAKPAAETKKVVSVIGYINVSSGCQQPLVDFLRQLAKKYGPRMTLEIVDFGTEEGFRRWRQDGQHCLTILVDGKPYVDLEEKGKKERVFFYGPPGSTWHHSYVEWAVAKLLGAPLPKLEKTRLDLKAVASLRQVRSREGPLTLGLVTIGPAPVYMIHADSSQKMQNRARAVARRLNGLLAKKVTSEEVKVQVQGEKVSLLIRGLKVYTITPEMAQPFGAKPKDMVETWAQILRELLPLKNPSDQRQ